MANRKSGKKKNPMTTPHESCLLFLSLGLGADETPGA